METKIITEGSTRLIVPVPDESASYPPGSQPVFYNPRMEMCRDITTALISTYIKKSMHVDEVNVSHLDVMAATGAHGIRAANEAGVSSTLNDWSLSAHELIQENIRLNSLQDTCKAMREPANNILSRGFYDIVDLDPFGTPAPYLDSAVRSARRLLQITAPDTAPLCGAHLQAGIRTYDAVPLNTEYHAEMGIRILLGKIFRTLAMHDKHAQVLLAYTSEHYVRAYVAVRDSATYANENFDNIGYITHCFNCQYREEYHGLTAFMSGDCPHCGAELRIAGPMYIGRTCDREFCKQLLEEIEKRSLNTRKRAAKMIELCTRELDAASSYDCHTLSKRLKATPPAMDDVLKKLKEIGYSASRVHYSGTCFKTNAGIEEIESIVKSTGNTN